MLRGSTDPGAPYYAAFVTSGGITVQDRATQGGGTSTVTTASGPAPAYLWVTDAGNTVTAYGSTDGYLWSPIAGSRVTLNLGSSVLAGLAVTSGNSAALSTVTANRSTRPSSSAGPRKVLPI